MLKEGFFHRECVTKVLPHSAIWSDFQRKNDTHTQFFCIYTNSCEALARCDVSRKSFAKSEATLVTHGFRFSGCGWSRRYVRLISYSSKCWHIFNIRAVTVFSTFRPLYVTDSWRKWSSINGWNGAKERNPQEQREKCAQMHPLGKEHKWSYRCGEGFPLPSVLPFFSP